MSDLGWLLEDVAASEEGPQVAAFFDFDGTLIDGYSAKTFFVDRLRTHDIRLREAIKTVAESAYVETSGADITHLTETAIKGLTGRAWSEVEAAGEDLFARKITKMVFPGVHTLLEAHVNKGHTIVIASAATLPQVQAAARSLGIPHLLVTQLEVDDNGNLTGKIDGVVRWGKGKAEAMKEFAEEHDIDLAASFAYSNGGEDVPMLELVGNPRPLNPDHKLAAVAEERDWPSARLFHPKPIGPREVVRSVMSYGALATGAVMGFGFAMLNNRRSGAKVAAGVGSDLGLALAGIDLNVIGREHLWSNRPAVFIFNHQSQLDAPIMGALLREDFTGVAKIEESHDPLFMPFGYLMEVAYVDRGNTKQAKEALAPVVDALKSGRSIAISPEGTRSYTDRILKFKKGPFHIAMQAEVPIVPIVIRNAGEFMRRGAAFIAGGRLDIKVLEPIDVSDWKVEDLDEHVADVRQLFIDAMSSWPRAEE